MQNAKWETAGRLRLLKINLLVLNGAGRFLLLLATFGLGAGPLSAQTSFVTLGNAKAHPTQILAKYKEQVILEQSGNVKVVYLEYAQASEIADVLGISETNVATKISRLKQRIRQEMEKENEK